MFISFYGFDGLQGSPDDAYSKYEFKKGSNSILVYLGLNRLDYNEGVQVSLQSYGGANKSWIELKGVKDGDYLGYAKEEIDYSMEKIKDYLTQALRTTQTSQNTGDGARGEQSNSI